MAWRLLHRQPKEPLVTREGLEKVVEGVKGLEPYRPFMQERWIGLVMWWHERSVAARRRYFALRAVVVAAGVTIPVLTTLSLLDEWGTPTAVAIAILGAIVAGAAAWEGIANYGEVWREKRRAAELLKVEGWQFIQLVGKYEPPDAGADRASSYAAAYRRFAAEVEAMAAREVGEYLGTFDASVEQARKNAADVLDAITQEAVAKLRASQQ